jgi:hypothetical protein
MTHSVETIELMVEHYFPLFDHSTAGSPEVCS